MAGSILLEIEPLISQFGYLAIFLGSIIEGEAVLLLGGFFAQKGYLSLPAVVLFGVLGTFCSEAALYHLGLSKGPALLRRSPRWLASYERFALRLHRHRYLLIIGYRFCYGMRSIAPLAIGASGIRPVLFHSLNLVGTLLWTLVLAVLGFFFGRTIGHFMENLDGFAVAVPVALIGAVLIYKAVSLSRGATIEAADGPDNDKVFLKEGSHER